MTMSFARFVPQTIRCGSMTYQPPLHFLQRSASRHVAVLATLIGTQNPDRGTWSVEPAVRTPNVELGTWNPEPGPRVLAPAFRPARPADPRSPAPFPAS